MKNILLKLDEEAFFKLKKAKDRLEWTDHKKLTWEEFVYYLKKYCDRH